MNKKTPALVAMFELDDKGRPKFEKRNGLKHYWIKLKVDGAPDDTYAVTYKLHESYYDPLRESRDRQNSFQHQLTSFGDYVVQAKIRAPQGIGSVAEPLKTALKRGHASNLSSPVVDALKDIAEN
jgi:hypothetical protein